VYFIDIDNHSLIKLLEADGWTLVAVRGSHHQYKHPSKLGRVTVPHPKKDLAKGTENSILKQAGLKGLQE
jgi:predicted RNA binding protein YcfA (HicA-like mRNA interferase family)